MARTVRNNYTSEYISGNTVRQVEPKREERTQVRPRTHSRRKAQINENALAMNMPYVAFLAVVALVCIVMCVMYLNVQASVANTRSNISQLKTQISTVQSQSDALNYSINSYVDTNKIQKTAKNRLGMVQATDDQISTYKPSDSGYTVQYGDIPTK